jgi:hypothetical protein
MKLEQIKQVGFEEAVTEGKKIVAETVLLERTNQLRLGELADTVEPVYGEQTLAKFAKAIGITSCTLARHRSVWRAWKKSAPGPVSYSVLRELQEHPDRLKIVTENPQITKAQAREHKGSSRAACKPRGFERDTARWFSGLVILANKVMREAGFEPRNPESRENLRKVLDPTLLLNLEVAGETLLRTANWLRALHDEELQKKAA